MCEIDWSAVADWVQGVGSVLAILIAVCIYKAQRADALAAEEKSRKEREISAISLLVPTLHALKLELAVFKDFCARQVTTANFRWMLGQCSIPRELAKIDADNSIWCHLNPNDIVTLGRLRLLAAIAFERAQRECTAAEEKAKPKLYSEELFQYAVIAYEPIMKLSESLQSALVGSGHESAAQLAKQLSDSFK